MTDAKTLLYMCVNNYIAKRCPMTVNGYTLKYSIDVYDYKDDTFAVVGNGYIYKQETTRVEVNTEHGLKTTWGNKLVPIIVDPIRVGACNVCESFSFHYKKDWLNGEYGYENESVPHYIFSKAPKEKVEEIRDTMKNFIAQLIQDCVDFRGRAE